MPFPLTRKIQVFFIFILLPMGILVATEPREEPQRPCHQLLTRLLESRNRSFTNQRLILTSLASRVNRDDKTILAHDDELPLTQRQLHALVRIKLALKSGELSLKALNDLEIAIDPDLRDAGVQADTSESIMNRFDDLLAYLHVRKAYERQGPKLEREIIESQDDAETALAKTTVKIDKILTAVDPQIELDRNARIRLFKALASNNVKLTDFERLFLKSMATRARLYTHDESLIAFRIAHHLARTPLNLPLASATAEDIHRGEVLTRDDLILQRLGIEVVVSPNIEVFKREMAKLSKRRTRALASFGSRFKVHVENGGVMVYDPRESSVALDILEAGLRVSRNPDRIYSDFARWTLGTRSAPAAAVEFLKSIERRRNTFSHRIYNWMNHSKLGVLTAVITATIGLGSSGSHIAHEVYDPRFPSYSQQWEILQQKSEQWSKQIENYRFKE